MCLTQRLPRRHHGHNIRMRQMAHLDANSRGNILFNVVGSSQMFT